MDKQLSPPYSSKPRGFALVIVLSALVLILGITVGLLSLAGTERRSASLYADSSDALREVDRILDIVQSQINAATMEGTFANPVSWASQPGMIRTFEGAGPRNIYKLYSWSDMTRPATGFTSDTIPDDWAAQPSVFTDLNEPVNGVYPILDPAVVVNGLSVTAAPGATANQPAPMPVQWLYVLKDGSLVTGAASDADADADVAGADRGDREIVARIAFWTDDETSKVNINTASEGLHWDAPRAEGGRERDMGRFQPVRFEVQRFPGHPAGVSLSEVFPASDFELADYSQTDFSPRLSTDLQDRASAIASLSPRVQFGGSLAALGATSNPSLVEDPIVQGASTLAGTRQIVAPDSGRLYATVDELLFSPTRDSQHADLSLADAQTATEEVAARSFVLTSHSVAPETTLFDTPKVSLWPIRASANLNAAPSLTNRADAYDKMLAIASSLPGSGGVRMPFYFQREDQLANNELSAIARNEEIYNYLKTLTGKQPPGFAQSIQAALGGAPNRNSLLVQAFDMIRAGVNLTEGGLVEFSGNDNTVKSFAYPGNIQQGWNNNDPVGHVQRTIHDDARGLGTTPYFTRIGVGIYCEKIELLNASGDPISGNETPEELRYTLRPAILVEAFSPMLGWGPRKQFKISVQVDSATGFDISAVDPGAGSGSWVTSVVDNSAARAMQSNSPAMGAGNETSAFTSPHLFLIRPVSAGTAEKIEDGLWGNEIVLKYPMPTSGDPPVPVAGNITELLDNIQADGPASWAHDLTMTAGSLELSLLDDDGNVYQTASVSFDATPELMVPHFGEDISKESNRDLLIDQSDSNTATHAFEKRHLAVATRQVGAFIANAGDIVTAKEIAASGRFGGDWRLAALETDLDENDFEYPKDTTGTEMRRHAFSRGLDSVSARATGDSALPLAGEDMPAHAVSGKLEQAAAWGMYRALATKVDGVGGAKDYALDRVSQAIGSFVPAPVEGGVGNVLTSGDQYRDSYFNEWSSNQGSNQFPLTAQTQLTFSPNRQVYSSMQMFGGLMRRAATNNPWETLLFSANPAGSHPGSEDHLFADLFWMPIVDPYPISETFSTAGKVNLNATLEPFTNIRRETALRAALKAIGIPVIDGSLTTNSATVSDIRNYTFAGPGWPGGGRTEPTFLNTGWTRGLDLDETLEGIRNYLTTNGVFRSATEICRVPLVPNGTTLTDYDSFWSNAGRRHTPDNLREQPYAHAYARLTTRSNTYMIHYHVQVLKKVPGTPDAQWIDGRDQVLAKYRGKALIERSLDPNATYPDYAMEADPELMSRFYTWRTLSNTRFSP